MSSTNQLVIQLKQANEDREFYPTKNSMIEVVLRRIPEDTHSIIDVGAGDGRVLGKFAEKCKDATLYGIELSQILIQAQPKNIVPVGTDVFEQNLSCLAVDYIFCNPPYSSYEEWCCKIIAEGYSKKAFLVIPQRWADSKSIKASLDARGAIARVIHSDDFLDGDRQARAVIDIVEVSFPKDKWGEKVADPFDIWFDQNIDTFDKASELPKEESGHDLSRKHSSSSIDEMVEAYREEYIRLENNYRAVFKLDYAILQELGVDKDHVRTGLKQKIAGLKTKYWQVLFDRLDAITSRLTTKSKKSLLEKLTNNAKVEFTSSNAYSVVLWAIKNANQYFDEQLIELFYELSNFEGVLNYKSNVRAWIKDGWRYGNHDKKNSHYILDYRIVVSRYNAIEKNGRIDKWDYPNGLNKTCHELIADVIAVMSNLGFGTDSEGSLSRNWVAGKWQDFYKGDDFIFQAKAHLNGNVHFRFEQSAIKALNITAGRLLKWLRTEEEVVAEMDCTPEEAKKYFNRNAYILPSNIKLLDAPATVKTDCEFCQTETEKDEAGYCVICKEFSF